jgi:HD-GYP domain-containing protein (c-di-GMP phosphodiesterase class II)
MFEVISLKDTLISFIESIDLFNYLLKNHQRRVAIIAYNLGVAAQLTPKELCDLVVAASLHDIGALTIAERDMLIDMDVENPRHHEIIGSAMLRVFPPFYRISSIIDHHHIKYNEVESYSSVEKIPRECFLLHLADRIEILIDSEEPTTLQAHDIITRINSYKGKLFAPWCIEIFNSISKSESFWTDIEHITMEALLKKIEFTDENILMNDGNLEKLATVFSRIVDFRSHFTASHSVSVGAVASEIGKIMFLSAGTCHKLRIAGLLHDIGKIAVPTEIIEKEGPLDSNEYSQIKSHAYYTYEILSKIEGLEDICSLASMHHERLDGSGYPFHIDALGFSLELEILAFADIFTSLCENRPYRQGRTEKEVLPILESFAPEQLSFEIYYVISNNFQWLNTIRYEAQKNANYYYHNTIEIPLMN